MLQMPRNASCTASSAACSPCDTVGKSIGWFSKPVVQFGESLMVLFGDSLNQRFIAWVIYCHTAKSRNRIKSGPQVARIIPASKGGIIWEYREPAAAFALSAPALKLLA